VIVPVYNTGKYLSFCIDSILQQTYTNFELLLIDDGSADNSAKICDEYAQKDNRIRVFHTKNQGSAMARNIGLDNARGEYISMIDSDDAIPSNYLESLIDTAALYNADIVCHFFKTFNDNGNIDTNKRVSVEKDCVANYTKDEALYKLVYGYNTYFISPVKLYKTLMFSNIRYPAVKKNDDEWVIHRILQNINRLTIIEKELYYYRFPSTGQTRNFSSDNFSGVLAFLDRAKKLQSNGNDSLILQAYINFFVRMVVFCEGCFKHKISPQKEFKNIRKDLRYACKLIVRNGERNVYSGRDKIAIILFAINYKLYRVFVKIFSINIVNK
jgi:glycosyltransferase involved in cell wall biosynthesis